MLAAPFFMNEDLQPSNACVELIKSSEDFRSHAYWDNGGYAVGYGTHAPDVTADTVWTEQEATDRLLERLKAIGSAIKALVKVPLTQGQFDALCDFCYNLGVGRLQESTLLRLLNLGEYERAGLELPKWDIADDEPSPGLKARRERELALYQS